ncbi:MAG: hypothetical protein LC746_15435 [Acidobacteria bacterium]|nr:hypothetical protein [Acidobacteriota bacterium]
MRTSLFKSRLTPVVGVVHLTYLGLLPALATFGVLYSYGYPDWMFIFLLVGGTAAVGVYVAVLFYYTPAPTSLGWSLFVLLDGPACALLSLYSKRGVPLGFAVEAFIVDGTAVCLSILVIAYRTAGGRAAAGWMLLALAAITSLVWHYFWEQLWGHWVSLALLLGGTLEAMLVRSRQLERDEAARDQNATAALIVVLLLAWVAALIAGNVLHELKLKGALPGGW